MQSAFRTFTSALGVCAACYLLSTASWQQVLLLFMVTGFGWCWLSTFSRSSNRGLTPHSVPAGMTEAGIQINEVVAESTPSKSPVSESPVDTRQAATKQPATKQPATKQPAARKRVRKASAAQQPAKAERQVERVQKIYHFPMHQLSR